QRSGSPDHDSNDGQDCASSASYDSLVWPAPGRAELIRPVSRTPAQPALYAIHRSRPGADLPAATIDRRTHVIAFLELDSDKARPSRIVNVPTRTGLGPVRPTVRRKGTEHPATKEPRSPQTRVAGAP